MKFKYFKLFFVALLASSLLACSTLHPYPKENDNPMILIPLDNEIEQVINFAEVENVNITGAWFPSLLPLSPSDQIHLFFSDSCGGLHSRYVMLDENDQIKKNIAFFSDQNPFDIFDTGLNIYSNPFSIISDQHEDLIYSSMIKEKDGEGNYLYVKGIFILNHEGKKEFFYPLEEQALSLYLYQDNILYFSDEEAVFFIEYPLSDSSVHYNLFSLNELVFPDELATNIKSELSIGNIVHVSASEIILELLLSRKTPFIVSINLDTRETKLIVTYEKAAKENQFIYSTSKNNWIVRYKNGQDERKINLYTLDGKSEIQILNHHIDQKFRLRMSIKKTPTGTYLYWIDNLILYRWKTPLS
jgi:hypothetical protein